MPEDRRAVVSHYRSGGGGREPLAAPGEGGDHIHYQPPRHQGLGVILSRRPANLFARPTGPTGPATDAR